CHLSWRSGWEVADHGPRCEKLSADTSMHRARPDPPEDPLPVSKRKSKSGKRKAGPWLNTDHPMNSDSWDEPVQPNASSGADVMGPKLGAFALKAFKVPTQKQLEFWQTDSMPTRHHLPNPKGQRINRRRDRQEQWMSGDWPPGGANEEVARDRAGANSKEEAKEVKTTDANSKVGTAATESGDWPPGGAKAVKEEVAPEQEKDAKTTDADSKVATAAVGGGGVKEEVAPKEEAKEVRMSDVDAKVATAADPTPSFASPFEEHRPHSEERPRAPLRRQLPIPLGQRTIGGQLRQRRVKEEVVPEKEVKMAETGSNVSEPAVPSPRCTSSSATQHRVSVRPQDREGLQQAPWRRRVLRRQLRQQRVKEEVVPEKEMRTKDVEVQDRASVRPQALQRAPWRSSRRTGSVRCEHSESASRTPSGSAARVATNLKFVWDVAKHGFVRAKKDCRRFKSMSTVLKCFRSDIRKSESSYTPSWQHAGATAGRFASHFSSLVLRSRKPKAPHWTSNRSRSHDSASMPTGRYTPRGYSTV
ncbi:unnamed protein product, partial [Symbiodinium necroappetens]